MKTDVLLTHYRSSIAYQVCLACCLLVASLLWTSTVWSAELTLGHYEQGVYDGASPFDSTLCDSPGKDCSDHNQRVRTNDLVQFAWSVVAGGLSGPEDKIDSVIFEQTLQSSDGAELEYLGIPAACLAPPVGNGGQFPASEIRVNANSTVTLFCNLGALGNGEQKSFSVAVQPQARSPDGSRFTSHQRVYGLDGVGSIVAAEFDYSDTREYTITAVPAFDLLGNRAPLTQGEVITLDIGNGPESGFVFQYTAHMAAATGHGALGIAPLGQVLEFNPGVFAVLPDGNTPFDLHYQVIGCEPNQFEWGSTVLGNEVANSGDCTVTGDTAAGFRISVSGVNTGTNDFPEQTLGGHSLATGPFMVAAYGLEIFVPFSEIDRADGVAGDNSGELHLGACLRDFDPDSPSGVSNYQGQFEPGYNGENMPNGDTSNNCTGLTSATLNIDSEFSFRAVSREDDQGTLTQYAPMITGYHAGDGVAEPGNSYATLLFFRNNGSVPLSGFSACTVFDNSVQVIADRQRTGATAGTFAYEGADSPADFNPDQWQIQYGVVTVSGDDPLSARLDGQRDFDAQSGRFNGRWSRLRKLRCDSSAIEWHDDITSIDPDLVNAVRFQAIDRVTQLHAGQEIRLVTSLTLRNTFLGGPHNGQSIPTGTVAAAFGSYRSTEQHPEWRANSYQPAPENDSADGDRITLARTRLDITLETALPLSAPAELKTVLAGNDIVWKLTPEVWSDQFVQDIVDNLLVTLQLPAGTSYNAGCTLAHSGGITPEVIEQDSPLAGQTELTWYLGDRPVNQALDSLLLCVSTDAYLAAGSVVTAVAQARADNTVSSTLRQHAVSLGQAGAILAKVDVADVLSVPGGGQSYILSWTNFSSTSAINDPVIINVLPFNGDGVGSAPRQPASHFSGSIALADEPHVSFLDGHLPGDSEAPIGVIRYTADPPGSIDQFPAANMSNWCEFDGVEFNAPSHGQACPSGWSEVTAIRFDSLHSLEPRGNERQGMQMHYTLNALANDTGDSYTSTFAVDSESLPGPQFLVSRAATVGVVSFSITGLVFAAMDGDLDFDIGTDHPVPDGVTLNLMQVATSEIVESVETKDGNYTFDRLLPGDYFIHVPASVFGQSGDLQGWSAATTDSGEAGSGDAKLNGVSTAPVNLETGASNAGQPTQVMDIALQPNDADQDGIPDRVEYGPGNSIINSVDTDGDGSPDYIDADSDGDGVLDSVEGSADTDGDGIPDYTDTDSDADGVPDAVEGEGDSDGDGIPDYTDTVNNIDTDGDSIPDSIEGSIDTDGDGVPNNADTDSDGDGIGDADEKNTDTDHDGVANYIDTDSDADGIDDLVEGTEDRDGNGVPDYIDNQQSIDTDGDGIADVLEGSGDSDEDGKSNSEDLDSDGDGIPDKVETTHDSDGDGIANFIDADSDNDTIPDSVEGAKDTDGDGIADFTDLDSDNDSITDFRERSDLEPAGNDSGRLDNMIDNNKDGIDDSVYASNSPVVDTDFDGVPDYIDLDSDNDGIPDVIESLSPGADQNRDGVIDAFTDNNGNGRAEKFEQETLFVTDTDGDGLPDLRDLDSDGDKRSDVRESGNPDANGDFIIDPMTDTDRDGVQDPADADQSGGADADADGIDDSADADFFNKPDTDGDGIADSSDPDIDGNGYYDLAQRDPAEGNNGYPDFDSNGTPDFQQTLTGSVTTGVGGEGVGCTVARPGLVDPVLPLLLLSSLAALLRRVRLRRDAVSR